MSSNYVAMMVTLVIWIGVFFYLLRLDRKVKKLEKQINRS
ncbi:MAG: CcmD family protein [candidate division Zixibacteria bacterium]|nr:CcmD family protein [candidate division Zixibacteria bacterium]